MVTNIFSPTPGYDTQIISAYPTTNYNTLTTLQIATSGGYAKTLLKMDLSKIPSNSIIYSASLFFRVAQAVGSTGNIYVRNLLQNWVLTQVTYNVYSTGNDWEVAGANGPTETDGICGNVSGGPFDLYDEIEIPLTTSHFTKLINGSQANNGWIIYIASGGIFFISANFGGAYIPRLEVTYDVPIVSSAIFL